jgi:hypothetical protein
MAIREKKLFFTRNGQYSVWEMLESLPEAPLRELASFALSEKFIDVYPPVLEAFPSFLFKVWSNIEVEEVKNDFYARIKNAFDLIDDPESDFNAHMYMISGVPLDLESCRLNLEELKKGLLDLEIKDIIIEFFIEEVTEVGKIIDVRFSSGKKQYYKVINEQERNTEIRVYLDLGIVMVTNFSDYTHSDKIKNVFLTQVVESVSTHRGTLIPKSMSDHLLRYLLAVSGSDKLPSKLKFEIDGRYTIGVDMGKPTALKDIINHESIGDIYNHGELFVVKVNLSEEDPDKAINIIGNEGKLISRAQNLNVEDINNFVLKVTELLKYDYLYNDYLNEIKILARRNLFSGTEYQKENQANACNESIKNCIDKYCNEISKPINKLLTNAFFYCIKEKIYLKNTVTIYNLDTSSLSFLSKISQSSKEEVNLLFSTLISCYLVNPVNGEFHILLHNLIYKEKAMPDAAGL